MGMQGISERNLRGIFTSHIWLRYGSDTFQIPFRSKLKLFDGKKTFKLFSPVKFSLKVRLSFNNKNELSMSSLGLNKKLNLRYLL
jgi:hypothetical protein